MIQEREENATPHDKELQIDQFHSDSEDGVEKALRNIREIPIEQYLSQEKAKIVRGREAQRKEEGKKLWNGKRKPSADKSGFANSRYQFSGLSDLDEAGRRQHRLA